MRIDQNLRIVAVEAVDAALVRSNNLASSTLTSAGASRRSVAERLADTTTSSIEMPFCATSKFSSSVSPRFSATEVLFGA